MIGRLLFLSFAVIAFHSLAKEELRPDRPAYRILSSVFDEDIPKYKSVFEFTLSGNNTAQEFVYIRYADNGKQYSKQIRTDQSYTITTNPGKHALEFSIGEYHHEITTDSILIKAQYRTIIELYFKSSEEQMLVKKPVIYLYPTEKKGVTVEVKPAGELFFTYPEYNDAWKFIASPNGTLSFGEDDFKYLFWESRQEVPKHLSFHPKGIVISSDDLLEYIESSLNQFGFTPSERSDFITYWLPYMKPYKYLYIYFVFNEDCDAFAELDISPKPDNLGRFYMLWSPIEGEHEILKQTTQKIPKLNRNGFTVIEWGGAQLNDKKKPGI